VEWLTGFDWNRWPESNGMTYQDRLELVAGINGIRNALCLSHHPRFVIIIENALGATKTHYFSG
jgi:hypothetical protein